MRTRFTKWACLIVTAVALAAGGQSVSVSAQFETNEPPSLPAVPAVPAVPGFETGAGTSRHYYEPSPVPVLFSDYVLNHGETNYGDVVVMRGDATIDGSLNGNLATVLGDVTINGLVMNDVQVIGGSLKVGPKADIRGHVVVVGGELTTAGASLPNAVNVKFGDNSAFLAARDWVCRGLLMGRPFPPQIGWVWIVAGVCLLVNLLLLLIFPRPIEACVTTIENKSVTSFLVGVLAKLLIGLFMVLLAVSMIGLIVVPFLGAAYLVAMLLGKVTTYRYVGLQLGKLTGLSVMQSPAATLLLGTVVFYLLYMVPYLGFLAFGFAGLFGFGGVVLATFEQYRSERRVAATPIHLGPLPGGTPGTPGQVAAFTAGSPISSSNPPGTAQQSDPTAAPSFTPLPVHSAAEVLAMARAGFWLRLVATALDLALFMITFGVFLHPRHMGGESILGLDWWDVTTVLWLVYHVCLWKWRGTTIGGIIVGIKLVRVDGRPLDYPVLVVRALASVLSFFVMCLGFFWVGFSRDKQSWHDKIAGTIIVKVPRGMSLV